jgi:HK97 family phage major capsid protein
MEADILALGREIERENRLAALDAELSKPTIEPIVNNPQKPEEEKTGRASNDYKAAMLNALRTNFKQVNNILETGNDQSGGYLVPEEYDSRLIIALGYIRAAVA